MLLILPYSQRLSLPNRESLKRNQAPSGRPRSIPKFEVFAVRRRFATPAVLHPNMRRPACDAVLLVAAALGARAETSDVPGLNRGLQLAVPSHRRELQTAVSTSAGLTSALANTTASRIVLAPGTYNLTAELNITRSVVIEAAVAGSVTLNAQASSSSPRRVLNINPGTSGVVQLFGLGITGGYSDAVRAHVQKFP
jgi:hypothetical protein